MVWQNIEMAKCGMARYGVAKNAMASLLAEH